MQCSNCIEDLGSRETTLPRNGSHGACAKSGKAHFREFKICSIPILAPGSGDRHRPTTPTLLFVSDARAYRIRTSHTPIPCTLACGMFAILAQAGGSNFGISVFGFGVLIGTVPVAGTLFNIHIRNSVHSQVFYTTSIMVRVPWQRTLSLSRLSIIKSAFRSHHCKRRTDKLKEKTDRKKADISDELS